MIVWCHRFGCESIIRNDREHLGTEPGNRTHVQVNGVPFCMDCYEPDLPTVHVGGVPAPNETVEVKEAYE